MPSQVQNPSPTRIVKVQAPVMTTEPDNPEKYLIYPQNRDPMRIQGISDHTKHAIGNSKKAFFKAFFDYTAQRWVLGNKVPDQDW